MRRFALTVWITFGLAGAAFAQDSAGANDMSGYSTMNFEAGYFVSGLDGRIDLMKDGVKITLLSDDPAKKPLPITANQMKFTWPEKGGTKPSRILLEGKVVIEHPQATVHADKADWDFEKGILVFTGAPVITTPQVKELRGEKVVLNFNEDRFEVFGGRAKEIHFGEAGPADGQTAATGASPMLRGDDIRDWPGFLTKIKAAAAVKEPSPGKHVVGLLDAKAQKFIQTLPVESLVQEKESILKQFNRVLASPKLYDAASWQGVEIDPKTAEELQKGGIDPKEQKRVNRALLEIAFPEFIAKAPKSAPEQTQEQK